MTLKTDLLCLNVQVWASVCNATLTDLVAETLQVWLHTALVRQTAAGDCFKENELEDVTSVV